MDIHLHYKIGNPKIIVIIGLFFYLRVAFHSRIRSEWSGHFCHPFSRFPQYSDVAEILAEIRAKKLTIFKI